MTELGAPTRKRSTCARILAVLGILGAALAVLCFEKPRHYVVRKVFSLPRAWNGARHVTHLATIDNVEVCLLRNPNVGSTNGNRIYGAEVVVATNLVGISAQELAMLWRQLPIVADPMEQSLCHSPVYGLRFSKGGERILESSYCWKCANITLPSLIGFDEVRFDETKPAATNLFVRLRSMFPLEEMTNAAQSYSPKPNAKLP